MSHAAMQREIAKAKKILHPNSRKAIAIAKRTTKISHRQDSKLATMIKQNLVGEKIMWMKEHMNFDVCPYTPELTGELLVKYIARNDEELEQIAIKRSIGPKRATQHATRESIIKMTKQREWEEFNTCGIEIPDILNRRQHEMLRKWGGELKFLPNFKFRRFGKHHMIKAMAKAAVNQSTNIIESSVSSPKDSKIKNIESSSIESKELNCLSENVTNECQMAVE
ncbi:translation machinery-associated protein 16 [Linepithema humile]|uniref:translation machinery-associated protein 16 n=1 Tax=Linepithema humile TaxID=83485 RepID=UPI00062379B1|nr:PREDICTED: translation machinery-associated protein 16 [Linepithema humile]